ncbi:helix-turn-helix transcriptional regulator [Pedobacter sp.]|uniref:helix-turn-helix transcriptional regulator n=1 Tax=Pedobacter sp. TaxID=1411316 RepID=UPI0031D1AAF8
MSTQEIDFLGNHLQLIEIKVKKEVSLALNVMNPCAFFVIMVQGLLRYYHHNTFNFYGVGHTMYMAYCPATQLQLHIGPGKHSLLVVALHQEWFPHLSGNTAALAPLVRSLEEESQHISILPMCKTDHFIQHLFYKIRMVNSNPFRRKAKIAAIISKLMGRYHHQLAKNNVIKRYVSMETANLIFNYVSQNFNAAKKITEEKIARHVNLPCWKLRECSKLIFGKSLHKQVQELRMMKAAELLRMTDIPIYAIGLKLGYNSDSHFYRIFKTFFEVSPKTYRNQHRT